MRTILLLRHARAGVRGTWSGPDLERPLDQRGERQAVALVGALSGEVTEIHTSRAERCRATVAPLADASGLEPHEQPLLLEGADATAALEWLLTLPDGAVACSHGDVIGGVLTILSSRGLRGEDTSRCPKGGLHRLVVDDDVVRSVTLQPPVEA